MTVYDRNRVSEEFRQLGDLADAMFRANLPKLAASPDAVPAHDELLARSCVFGYLYDRHFLCTPEMLVNELRWLRANRRPEAPRHSIHPRKFAEHRTALLDLLIHRFQNQLDFRDSLLEDEPGGHMVAPREAPADAAGSCRTVRQSSDPDAEAD